MFGHIWGDRRGIVPPRLFNNRLFDHEKVRMSRNEAKKSGKKSMGFIMQMPAVRASDSGHFSAN